MEQRADGLVLRTVDYGEADRIVTFLTREHGKVAMFARAARKSRKRFGGALELFQLVRLRFRDRRGNLATLADAHVLASRHHLTADYTLITHASYLTELVGETLQERQPMPELFDALDRAYDVLNSSEYAQAPGDVRGGWLAAFELKILSMAGYQPLLDGCADCSRSEGGFRFSPERGGLVCESCARRQGVSLSREAASRLAASLNRQVAELALDFTEREAFEARRALGGFIRYHLGKELRSARFLDL